MLAQAYVKADRYPRSPAAALAPEPRRRRLLDQLRAQDADVYCLQEVELDVFDALGTALPGHTGVYGQRRGRPDGCCVLFRAEALAQHAHEVIHLSAAARDDHLAVIVRLERGGRRLGVVSTHLQWQRPGTPPPEHLGRRQLSEILDRVEDLRADWPAWLIAGDFNARPDSAVIDAALERGWQLACAAQPPGDTVNIGGRPRTLDYQLYTPEALVPHPGELPRLQPTTPMPSAAYPSDHLPLQVAYTWR